MEGRCRFQRAVIYAGQKSHALSVAVEGAAAGLAVKGCVCRITGLTGRARPYRKLYQTLFECLLLDEFEAVVLAEVSRA
jgi:hypothetical protein